MPFNRCNISTMGWYDIHALEPAFKNALLFIINPVYYPNILKLLNLRKEIHVFILQKENIFKNLYKFKVYTIFSPEPNKYKMTFACDKIFMFEPKFRCLV